VVEKKCTNFNAPSFCDCLQQQYRAVFIKVLRKDHCLQVSKNLFQLVKYSLINSRDWIHVMSDVTLRVNITPLTIEVED